jgi:hypothetical protein
MLTYLFSHQKVDTSFLIVLLETSCLHNTENLKTRVMTPWFPLAFTILPLPLAFFFIKNINLGIKFN